YAAGRRARVPARPAGDRLRHRGHPGGRERLPRETGAGVDRSVSVAALRGRTSDRTPGGARGAQALALALDPEARLVGEFGEPRTGHWEDDLRDSHEAIV